MFLAGGHASGFKVGDSGQLLARRRRHRLELHDIKIKSRLGCKESYLIARRSSHLTLAPHVSVQTVEKIARSVARLPCRSLPSDSFLLLCHLRPDLRSHAHRAPSIPVLIHVFPFEIGSLACAAVALVLGLRTRRGPFRHRRQDLHIQEPAAGQLPLLLQLPVVALVRVVPARLPAAVTERDRADVPLLAAGALPLRGDARQRRHVLLHDLRPAAAAHGRALVQAEREADAAVLVVARGRVVHERVGESGRGAARVAVPAVLSGARERPAGAALPRVVLARARGEGLR